MRPAKVFSIIQLSNSRMADTRQDIHSTENVIQSMARI